MKLSLHLDTGGTGNVAGQEKKQHPILMIVFFKIHFPFAN